MIPRTLPITDQLRLPLGELEFRATPAGGPGGQHVNRSATRIELWWNVVESPSLDPDQRARLLARLATRLDASGRLRIVSASRRSQLQNRDEAIARLVSTVRTALHVAKPRRKTRVPRAAREARLDAKRRRGSLKSSRRPVRDDE
ncbi:MAG TPA: alternative ribosome rescue aminoacyl-tRNA hydrolase ArfB [Gemmatimonadales bacterium]|nr:alternative ribosome rescue aminoacyl-tRNA hydrolase ArfB [Gemmatimonadales bacterium]